MAEIAVNLVLDELVLLIEEGKLLGDVSRDFVSIKDELEFLRPFLRDVDERFGRGEIEERVKKWMRRLREDSLHLEDVIDKHKLHLAQNQQPQGWFYFLRNFKYLMNFKYRKLHMLSMKIKFISNSIRLLQEEGNTYGLRIKGEGSGSGSRNFCVKTFSMRDNKDIVGIESPQDDELIRRWLAKEASPNRTVLAVVGAGGLGKTTLIQNVYKNQIATSDFLCRVWINVSRSYKREELLRSLIRRFYEVKELSSPNEIETSDETSLISMLRKFLQEERYAVVLDDVWCTNLWESIKDALPDNNKSSRVIVTTRENAVASSFTTSQFDLFLELNPLAPEKARKLFSRKVFQSDYDCCPRELRGLSEKIVDKCDGIPLAIVVIGGLLRSKDKTVFEWRRFYDSLPSHFNIKLKTILFLSYLDLSYILKSCFLYFGIFPEDYPISHGRLVRSWIAEGFIKERRGHTLEQIAEECLTELVHRSLVQVSKVNSIGQPRRYRVHGVMRELIISTATDMDFCRILSEEGSCFDGQVRQSEEGSCFDGQVRRLSVHNRPNTVLKGITEPNIMIRSAFTFGEDKLPNSFVGTLIENLKLVKVLDFEDAPIDNLPEEVGNLLLLKYLSLRNTKVKTLPKSIGKLQNLLTLDLKKSLVSELPSVICRLRKLRHLLAYVVNKNIGFEQDYQQGVKIHEGFGFLEDLHKLYFVEAYHGRGLFRELEKLRQLRKLGIKNLKSQDGEALCTAIENMRHLDTLDVWPVKKEDILDLQHISSPPPSLEQLYLQGHLESFPSWISKLQHLFRLTLRWSRLKDDPLRFLQHLPGLLELKLMDAYDGEVLCFQEKGFQKLIVLELRALDNLCSVEVKTGALPVLQIAHISSCRQLKQLPEEIEMKLKKKKGGEAMEY